MVGLNWDDLVQGVCGSVSSSWLMIIGLCCICSWYGTVHGWQRKHNETTRLIPREDGGFCGEYSIVGVLQWWLLACMVRRVEDMVL